MRKVTNEWLLQRLKATAYQSDSEFFNQWVEGESMTKYIYNFYYDDKYHWVVKHPNGQDQVVDPELWAKFFNVKIMSEGIHFFSTEVVDPIYGSFRLEIELHWVDNMMKGVHLCAPDGDVVKQYLKRFHISRNELI